MLSLLGNGWTGWIQFDEPWQTDGGEGGRRGKEEEARELVQVKDASGRLIIIYTFSLSRLMVNREGLRSIIAAVGNSSIDLGETQTEFAHRMFLLNIACSRNLFKTS